MDNKMAKCEKLQLLVTTLNNEKHTCFYIGSSNITNTTLHHYDIASLRYFISNQNIMIYSNNIATIEIVNVFPFSKQIGEINRFVQE